jgi:hypothetical protein
MTEIDDIKKLTPEERIRRLKKLEEEKRKEIDEAEKLLKQSEEEFEETEKLRKDIPIPQMKAVDIDALFTPEEKQLFATKRYKDSRPAEEEKEEKKEKPAESDLEETVWKEAPKLAPEQLAEQKAYGEQLAQTMTVRDINQEIYTINEQAETAGYMSGEMQERKTAMIYAALEKDRERNDGSYHPSKEADNVLSNLVQAYKR